MYVVRSPQPLTRETANPNAATAAASAFGRRDSNASLSSAAAAAALKARPTSPTNVADVQSKRALRRSPSLSSAAGRDTSRRRELTRTPSVGSMMERTFRSPSPGRSPAPRSRDVPPVPSLPDTDNITSSAANSPSHRRSAALQTQNFRTASEKMKDGQRGSWFGAATARDPGTVRKTNSAMQLASHQSLEPRPGSVSPSINFSYPRARMQSPSGSVRSLQTDDRTLVYDANSRRMVPRGDLIARSQSMREPADDMQLKKKKKKKSTSKTRQDLDRTGSHLSKGTVARTMAPALDTLGGDAETAPDVDAAITPAATTSGTKKNKAKVKKSAEEGNQAPGLDDQNAAPAASSSATGELPNGARDAEQPQNAMAKETHEGTDVSAATPPKGSPGQVKVRNSVNGVTKTPNSKMNGKASAARMHSESPARSARFASSTDQLVVRHEPPPRSLSPRKSAMKHASPTRAVSPSDDGSEASAVALGSSLKDDAARKKSARVSWDDRNTVVVSESSQQENEATTSTTPSPQSKKPWLNVKGSKGTKKEVASVEKEETMSPRPALPSFGSVREKKPKDQEERPLVRPQEHAATAPPSSDTNQAAPEQIGDTTQQVTDSVPHILPSIEGDDHASSSDGSLMDDTTDDDVGNVDDKERSNAVALSADNAEVNAGGQVPAISVSHASPSQTGVDLGEDDNIGAVVDVQADDESGSDSDEVDSDDAAVAPTATQMDDIVEEEEDDLYSDAYEDMSEVDGDGFMSLDAVLGSPTASPAAKNSADQQTKEVASTNDKADGADTEHPTDDWENAKAYWKSLSLEKRRELEQEAEAEATHETPKSKPHGKKKDPESGAAEQEKTVTKNGRVYQIQPGSTLSHEALSESVSAASGTNATPSNAHLRQSMRTEHKNSPSSVSQSASGMRKSMRSDRPMSSGSVEGIVQRRAESQPAASRASTGMKKSLRHNSVDLDIPGRGPSVTSTGRPASYHPSNSDGAAKAHKRNRSVDAALSSSTAGLGPSMKSTLRRRGSDSSESSFTRMRSGSGGAKEFRKSMRGSMREAPAAADEEASFRRNSFSSRPTSSGAGMGRMRQSLRGESVDRNSRKRMSGLAKSPAANRKKSRSSSRFVDSSDEEEPLSLFKSRFADSDSDEDEAPTSKGRGMPKSLRSKANKRATSSAIDLRTSGGGLYSPHLSEQEDGISQPKRSQLGGTSQLQRNGSGRGALLPLPAPAFANEAGDSANHPNSSRRGSFMSILRRKKDPAAKVTRPELVESAARRDTRLERTANELELVRSNHGDDNSWPLPQAENARDDVAGSIEMERPSTAGGPIRSSTPKKFLRRRSASQGTTPVGPDPFAGGTSPQKKKKFGALRKMFGLND